MTDDTIIEVKRVSKKFSRSLKCAMAYGIKDIMNASILGRNTQDQDLKRSEFWALKDVDFSVKRGECIGLIGANGAGKSTLFSILSGIYGPSRGAVSIKGKLQALIALGAGFHPLLSGRENVYINSAILGMRRKDTDAIFDEIVDFAELGEFIDMPIKNYSSGMLVRLGFAVAVHMQPEILLVDEVLAVGDMAFRQKSHRKMMELINRGKGVMLVSHSSPAIERLATRVIWMDHGQIRAIGDPVEILAEYADFMQQTQHRDYVAKEQLSDRLHPIRITGLETLDETYTVRETFGFNETIVLRLHYESLEDLEHPYFAVDFAKNAQHSGVFTTCSMGDDLCKCPVKKGKGYVECIINDPHISHGEYAVHGTIYRDVTTSLGQMPYQDRTYLGSFNVKATAEEMGLPGMLKSLPHDKPPIVLDHRWSMNGTSE